MKLSENIRALMGIITRKSSDRLFMHKVARTGASFVLSKGVAFLAPIILVGFVSLYDYGKVEYSYGIGRLFAGIAGCGLGGYPYFILKKGETNKRAYFYGYGLVGIGASVLFLFLKLIWNLPVEFFFSYLFIFLFAIQGQYSTILKTEDKGHKGVLIDSGYYFILTAVILCKIVYKDLQILPVLMWLMWVYLCLLSLLFLQRFLYLYSRLDQEMSLTELREIVFYGLPLVLSGFIIFWLTSSARVYIGHLIGYEQVGIYSFYFRIVGISMVLQQFLYVTFFKNLYMGTSEFLDKYYTVMMTAIFVCCVLACTVSVPIVRYFITDKDFSDYKLMLLLCVQMPMWVGISFCEGLTGRENIVNKMNLRLGVVVGVIALLLFAFGSHLDLHLFTLCMIFQFGMAFATQLRLLGKRGVVLPKCKLFSFISVLFGVIIYML